MKIGVIGSGSVAQELALGFLELGHPVTLGTRHPEKLAAWWNNRPKACIGTFEEAAAFGDVVVLAVKGSVAAEALRLAGQANFRGKPIIDACNPIADSPPEDGVLRFFTSLDDSLMERLQKEFPHAHFVKAFNSVGASLMFRPQLHDGPPTMFICGNNAKAKKKVAALVEAFGWEPEDMGSAVAARAIEPLCILWCIPGFARNEWRHAFKLLKPNRPA